MSDVKFLDKLLDGVAVEWKALGEVCRFINGRAYKQPELLSQGKYPVLRVGNFFTNDNWYYSNLELDEDKYCDKGDLLYAWSASFGPRIWAGGKVIYHYHIWKVIPDADLIHKKFLYYLLEWDTKALKEEHGTGSTMMHVGKGSIEKRLVPIPCPDNPKKSLEIQAEIVRILDSFTELTTELTTELATRKKQYNHYRDQLFSFEDGEVEWKTLGDVCDFKNGFAFKSNLFRDAGQPIIRITNINGSGVDMVDVKYFNPADYKENTQNYVIENGDILIAMSGATTGKIGCFKGNRVAYLNQRVGKFIPKHNVLSNRYLYHFLISKIDAIYILAGGGAQPNLSSKALMEKILIPIPHAEDLTKSAAEQKRIANILDKLDTLTNSITEGLPREIELRQKQYEHYRDLFLSFPKPQEVVA